LLLTESARQLELFTIGHSTHSIERFLELLEQNRIAALVDIRRFPSSRNCPQFNQPELASALQGHGIEYRWLEALGGRRPKEKNATSANAGFRNESFRNYADYMQTEPFRQGMAELTRIAETKRTAIMCAENVFWRCHRRLVSDFVVAQGGTVEHIFPGGEIKPHEPTEGVVTQDGNVSYPGERTLFD
jgi:uncharacterized protein (DUF488 family)